MTIHKIIFTLQFITTIAAFTTFKTTTKLSITELYKSNPSRDSDKNEENDPERDNRQNLDHQSRYERLIQGDYDLSRFPKPLMDDQCRYYDPSDRGMVS